VPPRPRDDSGEEQADEWIFAAAPAYRETS